MWDIIQFRDINISYLLFGVYVNQLLLLGQRTKISTLFDLKLNDQEKQSVHECCIKYDLKERKTDYIEHH